MPGREENQTDERRERIRHQIFEYLFTMSTDDMMEVLNFIEDLPAQKGEKKE